jgi:hypothetical protein
MRVRTKFRNEEDWEDYALQLISGPEADVFARALDHFGWMVVPQEDNPQPRWCMDEPCPSWAASWASTHPPPHSCTSSTAASRTRRPPNSHRRGIEAGAMRAGLCGLLRPGKRVAA